jgi:hypothetical protein
MCTFYKGKPVGLAYIEHKDTTPYHAFEGIGVFTDGELHMGPFLCKTDKGKRKLYTQMIDGRPGDKFFHTTFF